MKVNIRIAPRQTKQAASRPKYDGNAAIQDGNELLEQHALMARAINKELYQAVKDFKSTFGGDYTPHHLALREFMLRDIFPRVMAVNSVEDDCQTIAIGMTEVEPGTSEASEISTQISELFNVARQATIRASQIRIIEFVARTFEIGDTAVKQALGYEKDRNTTNEKLLSELRQLSRLSRQQEIDGKESPMPRSQPGRPVNKP